MPGNRRDALLPPLFFGLGLALYLAPLQRLLVSLFWPKVGQSLLLLSLFGAGVGALIVFLLPVSRRRGLFRLEGWICLLWGAMALGLLFALAGQADHLWPGKGLSLTSFPPPFLLLLGAPLLLAGVALGTWAEAGEENRAGYFFLALGAGLLGSFLVPLAPPQLALCGIVAGTFPALVIGGGAARRSRLLGALVLLAALIAMIATGTVALRYLPPAGPSATANAAPTAPAVSLWTRKTRLEILDQPGTAMLLGMDRRLREDLIAPRESARFPFPLVPGADGRLDVLLLGFPNGGLLTALMQREDCRFTVLENDAVLVAEVFRRWPSLAAAAAAGRFEIVGGNPRWFFARHPGRFDLIVLAENYSFKAYLSWALNFTRDYRYTVEAFRRYLDHLEPEGILFVQRTGIGRVVSTLREAYGRPPAEFLEKVVVLGEGGKLISQCYFRHQSFVDRPSLLTLYQYVNDTGALTLYRPYSRWRWSFYYPLICGEKVKGYYFSTPLDLSPTTDERPFFDHLERLMISPSGRPLPEELDQVEVGWVLRFIPGGDWSYWSVLLAGFALGGIAIALVFLRARRRSGSGARVRAPLLTCLFLGAAAALGLNAYRAWADCYGPTAPPAVWGVALAVLAFGLGWLMPGRTSRRRGLVHLAVILIAVGAGGYRIAPLVPRIGPAGWGLIVAVVGILLGVAAGRSLRVALADLQACVPGTASWSVGAIAYFAVVSWIAGELLAVNFGYPLLWFLAGAAALAVLRERRFLPPAPPS